MNRFFRSLGKLFSPSSKSEVDVACTKYEHPTIPLVEGSQILPYVYYQEGQSAVKAFELEMDYASGITQKAVYTPQSSPEFDNVMGFKIDDNLTFLRYWGYFYPDHCRHLAKVFGGRIPTEEEFLKIAAKLHEINASLNSITETTLYKGNYLIADNAAPYDSRTINIENVEKKDYIDFDDNCCFLVVK